MIHVLPSPKPVLDRRCEERVAPGFLTSIQSAQQLRIMLFHQNKTLTRADSVDFLSAEDLAGLPDSTVTIYLGSVSAGAHPTLPAGTELVLKVLANDVDPSPFVPAASELAGYRDAAAQLSEADSAIFIQAQAVAAWHVSHPRCPRCGAATTVEQAGWMRRCVIDGSEHFPRTDPAVIVAIVGADDRILLANNFSWDANRYSTVAGFVEAGENLEQAAVREIFEEVGVKMHRVEYLGSQSWPFPRSLMFGYLGRTNDSQPVPDGKEVREARWFSRSELQELVSNGEVKISQRLSIARALIEHWYGGRIFDQGENPDTTGEEQAGANNEQ